MRYHLLIKIEEQMKNDGLQVISLGQMIESDIRFGSDGYLILSPAPQPEKIQVDICGINKCAVI